VYQRSPFPERLLVRSEVLQTQYDLVAWLQQVEADETRSPGFRLDSLNVRN
jgi:hypothetical protein